MTVLLVLPRIAGSPKFDVVKFSQVGEVPVSLSSHSCLAKMCFLVLVYYLMVLELKLWQHMQTLHSHQGWCYHLCQLSFCAYETEVQQICLVSMSAIFWYILILWCILTGAKRIILTFTHSCKYLIFTVAYWTVACVKSYHFQQPMLQYYQLYCLCMLVLLSAL